CSFYSFSLPDALPILRELDVAVAESVASACATSAVVIVSVTDYDATREMLIAEIGSMLEGRTLVQLSSGTPSETREMARWAAERSEEHTSELQSLENL